MNNYTFKSVLAIYMEQLLEHKKSMGYDLTPTLSVLKNFDIYLCKNEQIEPHLTSDFFQKWHISRVNDSPRTLRKKFSVWKQLTSLMCRVGCHCFIPQMPLNLKSDFTPYIFTQEQITAIFKSCDTLVLQRHNTNSSLFAIPALLRILYSTGLRISEALNLKNEDVDLKKHVIKITQTKNGCARIVPICIELEEVLRQYLKSLLSTKIN